MSTKPRKRVREPVYYADPVALKTTHVIGKV